LTANTSPTDWRLQQELIPNQVAHAVVDHLEPIKVHEENGKQMVFTALLMLDEPAYPVNKKQPVR